MNSKILTFYYTKRQECATLSLLPHDFPFSAICLQYICISDEHKTAIVLFATINVSVYFALYYVCFFSVFILQRHKNGPFKYLDKKGAIHVVWNLAADMRTM